MLSYTSFIFVCPLTSFEWTLVCSHFIGCNHTSTVFFLSLHLDAATIGSCSSSLYKMELSERFFSTAYSVNFSDNPLKKLCCREIGGLSFAHCPLCSADVSSQMLKCGFFP